jgi:hypothetical protein
MLEVIVNVNAHVGTTATATYTNGIARLASTLSARITAHGPNERMRKASKQLHHKLSIVEVVSCLCIVHVGVARWIARCQCEGAGADMHK